MDEELKVKTSRLQEAYKKCEGMREFIDIVFPEMNRSRCLDIGQKFWKKTLGRERIYMLLQFPDKTFVLTIISGFYSGSMVTTPVELNLRDVPDDSPLWGEGGRDAWEEIED